MTEAEKALVDFVLSCHWGIETVEQVRINDLAVAVAAERVSPEAKRAWIDAWKGRERARVHAKKVSESLRLPDGLNLDSWRNEALAELENE